MLDIPSPRSFQNICLLLLAQQSSEHVKQGFPMPFTQGGGGTSARGGLMRGDIDPMGGDVTSIDYIINEKYCYC